jgi:peptidyl-dipeptidase A
MRPAATLVADLEARLRPLELELSEAWWEANTRSSPEADERRTRAELAHRELLADGALFAELCEARAAGVDDPLLARQLDVLHDAFVPNQVDPDLMREVVELETQVASTFNTYRATVDGRRVDDNDISEILRTSDDDGQRRAAWEASKSIGPQVAHRVRELARLRNRAARALGFRDHFELSLATGELDERRLFATLDEVDGATRGPFATWKETLDRALAERFGLTVAELRPWHLEDPFFQTPPSAGALPLDHLFAGADLEALTVRTFDGLGLDVRTVLTNSDLYARDGKSQHAFCVDIDREGDVRVLCNVEPSERWMDTMLHEFGHAIYDRECDRTLPWLLRGAAHALTTEGIAMLMGRLTRRPEWLGAIAAVDGGVLDDDLREALAASRRAALLVFARWVLVMTNFERSLYEDPDGDLDTRWWDLVERYQMLTRPDGRHAPDWAAKIHLAVAPVYYQNYLYGELFASQMQRTLELQAGGIVDTDAAGALLAREVFAPGASKRWDALVVAATGEPLSARAFAQELRA